jgi:hypothetical protein
MLTVGGLLSGASCSAALATLASTHAARIITVDS